MPISSSTASSMFPSDDLELSHVEPNVEKKAPPDGTTTIDNMHDQEPVDSGVNDIENDEDDVEDEEGDSKILQLVIRDVLDQQMTSELQRPPLSPESSSPHETMRVSSHPVGKDEDLFVDKRLENGKSVSFSGIDSLDSKDDEEKNRDELVDKIGKIQAKLTQAEIDKSAEKAMRKQKEKSLVKLAKELTKRAADQAEKEKVITTLKGTVADLEAKLNATRSEMDERIAAYEKKTKEYNGQLDEAHQKYRAVVAEHDGRTAELTRAHIVETESLRRSGKEAEIECERLRTQIGQLNQQMDEKVNDSLKMAENHKLQLLDAQKKFKDAADEHENRISDISKKHTEQIDDLRGQLLAANLQCDKIRTELAGLQMKAAPGDAAAIVNRTMMSAALKDNAPTKVVRRSSIVSIVQIVGVIVSIVCVVAYQIGLDSMDAVCSPAMPGTVLDKDSKMEAPWFAPGSSAVFSRICGERPQTTLTWASGRLVVTTDNATKTLLDRKSTRVVLKGDSIKFIDKKGKIEAIRAPWSK